MLSAGDVWPHYENFTQKERDDRDREVIETLANNLNRSEIKKIHLFYIKDHEMEVSIWAKSESVKGMKWR